MRPIHAVHHQTGNYRVTVQGNAAEAFCYGTATHYRPTTTGHNIRTFVGSYDFTLSRLDGHWRITTFRFNCKFIDGNVDLDKSQ